MKTKWVTLVMASSALAFSGAAFAGDAAAGETKAEVCMECHDPGEDFAGVSADEIAAARREGCIE